MVSFRYVWFAIYSEYHALEIVFTRQKARADANPQSPPITHPEINICDLCTPSRKIFAQEQNELFVQQVVQYSQDFEGEYLYYHVLGLNESSAEDDLK